VALTAAVRRAWASGARRVTVNTCELDGPHALANYLARGFVVARETIELRRRLGGPVSEIRDGDLPGEAAGLEALQLRASLVWDEYREQLAAEPGVVALPADGRVRVAVGEDGRRLGFSVVLPRSGAGAWELDGLFVEPDVQGRGVGRLLVNDVVGAARAAGVARIDVVAGPARAFYERLGFTVTGDAPTRFGPAHRMSRAL
jgi:GNAT superfamily N-acetyltransferase